MQPLSDFTHDFRNALTTGPGRIGLNYTDAEEAARRFAVYRNNVAHSLKQALARRFPVIQRLVGAEFFTALAREFISKHPPRSPVLQEWGGAMPGFLRDFPQVAALPYLPDIARIEWACGLAYHADNAQPIDPSTLAERKTLHLHPSLTLLRLDHPAVSIWQANQPGQNGRIKVNGPETALIWRRSDFSVATIGIGADDAGFITGLLETGSLVKAAEITDPVAMLSLLLREKLICEEETTT